MFAEQLRASSPRALRPLGLLALSSALIAPAHAFPTSNPLPGISGLGLTPNTETVAPGQVELGLQYEKVDVDDGDVDVFPVATLNYGLEKGEIGAVYTREKSDFGGFESKNNYFALHGKYRVFENAKGTEVAVGAHYYDFGSDDGFDLGSLTSLYVVGSARLDRKSAQPEKVRLSGGLLLQRAKSEDDSQTKLRPFVGLQFRATPEVTLAADYVARGGDIQKGYSFVARYEPTASRFAAQVGVGKLSDDTKFFAGLTYRFGG